MLAKNNEYVAEVSETLYQSSMSPAVRTGVEAIEEGRRVRRGLERMLAESQEELKETKETLSSVITIISEKDAKIATITAEKDAEIARLRAELEAAKK